MEYKLTKIALWLIFLPRYLTLCPREQIGDFTWDVTVSSSDEKTSTPICLDNYRLPVTRKCVQNKWKPSAKIINCVHKQNDNWDETFCPPDYKRISNTKLCILISAPQNWSELCLQSTEFDPSNYNSNSNIQNVLYAHGTGPYWLPIRRDHHLEQVKYKIVTRYNIQFDELLISEPIDGNCISLRYSSSKWTFQLSNCEKHYSMVCLIDIDKYYKFSKHHCRDDYTTTFNPLYHNYCYKLVQFSIANSFTPITINGPAKQFFMNKFIEHQNMSASHIQINVMPLSNGLDFNLPKWMESQSSINFTNWNPHFQNSVLNNSAIYSTLKNKRWHLITGTQLIQFGIQIMAIDSITDPIIELRFNKMSNKIDKRNQFFSNFLTYSCFLNDVLKHEATDTFNHDIGRHSFWCEGFKVGTLTLIKSPILVIWNNETLQFETFVIILEKGCDKCDFIFEARSLQNTAKWNDLANQIFTTKYLNDGKIQFRKIIDINVNSKKTKFSLHLLVKKVVPFKILYEIIDDINHKWPYKVIDLRYIGNCIGGRGKYFKFADAKIGKTSKNKYCRQPNGAHPILKCAGNLDLGAYWENDYILNYVKCDYVKLLKEVNKNVSSRNPLEILNIVQSISKTYNDVDSMTYTNKIIDELLNSTNNTKLFDLDPELSAGKRPFGRLMKTYDNALQINDLNITDPQATGNISSEFLFNYKKIIEVYLQSNAAKKDLRRSTDGTHTIRERNIILLVTDPFWSKVSGMAIHKKQLRRKEKNFNGFSILKLSSNKNAKEIVNRRLEAAINIPQFIIDKLKRNFTNFRIVLSVFYKDSWFTRSSHNESDSFITSKSKIIGIFIPEYPSNELPDGIFSVLKTTRNKRSINLGGCSNWRMGIQERGWNKNFHSYDELSSGLLNCPIKHTAFSGYVQLIGTDKFTDCDINLHANIIKWITVTMSTISAVSIILIFVAALKIQVFRLNETTPLILIQAFANGLQIVVFILFVELDLFNADGNAMIEELCLATGAILHYLTLVGFFLSLFATDHLIRAYVIGLNQLVATTLKTKIILFGWMLPIVVIGSSLMIDIIFETELYLPIDILNDHSSICYPVEELLLFSIHIPIALIVALHLIIFIWVVIKTNMNPESVITDVSLMKEKCQTYVYIFSILSITWLFAVVAYYVQDCWMHIIFSYLFAITAPSQGFQIFLVCVVFNGQVQLYFKRWYRNRKFQ